jgi:signal transduction histidine kinase
MTLAAHHSLRQEVSVNRRQGNEKQELGKDGHNGSDSAISLHDNSGIDQNTLATMTLLQAPAGVIVCDIRGNVMLVNNFAREFFQEDFQGQSMECAPSIWGELVDEDGRLTPVEEWPCMKALRGETIATRGYRLSRQSGSSYQLQISAAPLRAPDGRIVAAVMIVVDITGNKGQELIRLDEALMDERLRIAGNIHDSVSQGLNAGVLQIRAARKELADCLRRTRTHLRRALETTMYSLAEARRATSMLSSDLSEREDPGAVLHYMTRQLFAGLNIELQFSFDEPMEALAPSIRVELIQIGKEALTNVVKHAGASKVRVDLRYNKSNTELNVVDNGRGFLVTRLPGKEGGFGLINMRLRAERLGGKVGIQSRPGWGTSVTALLPLNPSIARSNQY